MKDTAYTKEEIRRVGNELPERGLLCHRCKAIIPQFADLSETDESRVRDLISQGRSIMAIAELRKATGCSLPWAKIWVTHRGRPEPLENDTAPCPYCGKPLRTSLAKQCRFCKRDWHEQD